jgi:hypothetical protein
MFKKKNVKVLKVGDRLVECCTIKGLADILGKSRDSVSRYEELSYFQDAPLRLGSYRYYPVSLAKRLKPLVAKFPSNRPPSAELLVEINKVFNDERNKLCQQERNPQSEEV